MVNFTLIPVLICTFCCISVSPYEFHTVEAQSGEEVTLLCSSFSIFHSQVKWFKVVKRSELRCVTFMFDSVHPASNSDGFKNGKFDVSSNMTTVFLKIHSLNSSDSGLYFCGYYIFNNNLVITEATNLEVQEVILELTNLMIWVLGALTVFLFVVITCLVVKIKKLHKARVEEQKPQETQRQSSDDLDYAAVTFHPKIERHYRPASKAEIEPDVIYSAIK
ncbi:uncharacterized protein LOC125019327 [Mugil cephalus]|uniref:uncharacterized protein LOC125019327 n=1 Tax=Mugil cephalus TaxID=48193 RepID=UPI001FB59FF4|nr:uncharacterized protein LOC125019327 [Mugil cephalus]